jgi:hypothetical protein
LKTVSNVFILYDWSKFISTLLFVKDNLMHNSKVIFDGQLIIDIGNTLKEIHFIYDEPVVLNIENINYWLNKIDKKL